jgi:predicted amidophosphoribosyltransferase
MDPLILYILMSMCALSVCLSAVFAWQPDKRACQSCGKPTPLQNRRCRHCGEITNR